MENKQYGLSLTIIFIINLPIVYFHDKLMEYFCL